MAEGEASTQTEGGSDECLHCAIMDMVEERLAAGGADAASIIALITEALVEVILLVPEEERAKLMAHTLSVLGDLFLQKGNPDGGSSGSMH